MRLFHAVSQAEGDQIARRGSLETIPTSLEGKGLAESEDDAREWGRALEKLSGAPHAIIVVVDVPADLAARLFRLPSLDNIGPARFIEAADLHKCTIEGMQ